MGIGSTANSIQVQLSILLRNIAKETQKLTTGNRIPNVESSDNASYFDKLEKWQMELDLFQKWIGNMKGAMQLRSTQARGLPRQLRYPENQSINDLVGSIESADQLAQHAAEALRDLFERSVTPTELDRVEQFFSLVNSQVEFIKELDTLEQTVKKAIRTGKLSGKQRGEARMAIVAARSRIQTPHGATQVATTDYLVMATLLLTLLRIWWLEKFRQHR